MIKNDTTENESMDSHSEDNQDSFYWGNQLTGDNNEPPVFPAAP
jgi:hypothetical protein